MNAHYQQRNFSLRRSEWNAKKAFRKKKKIVSSWFQVFTKFKKRLQPAFVALVSGETLAKAELTRWMQELRRPGPGAWTLTLAKRIHSITNLSRVTKCTTPCLSRSRSNRKSNKFRRRERMNRSISLTLKLRKQKRKWIGWPKSKKQITE